jgi:15-cis-phytoene synthase
MTPHEYCEAKAVRSGSTLYYTLLFLPEERRKATATLHAFSREVNGVVREVREPAVVQAKLGWWREEVGRIYRGRPQHPVAVALAEAAGNYRLDEASLLDIVEAAQMDLRYNAYPDFDALKAYCVRAGGSLGTLSAHVFGFEDAGTLEFTNDLGVACQLTRIIRDVGEDTRRNHIYLPLHELAEFGVTSDDIAQARETDEFGRLMAFQVQRAEEWHDRAFSKLPPVDRKAQRPAIVMGAINRALLEEIRADGCHVLSQRTSLTPLRKFWIAWRTWLRG